MSDWNHRDRKKQRVRNSKMGSGIPNKGQKSHRKKPRKHTKGRRFRKAGDRET